MAGEAWCGSCGEEAALDDLLVTERGYSCDACHAELDSGPEVDELVRARGLRVIPVGAAALSLALVAAAAPFAMDHGTWLEPFFLLSTLAVVMVGPAAGPLLLVGGIAERRHLRALHDVEPTAVHPLARGGAVAGMVGGAALSLAALGYWAALFFWS